MIVSNTSPIINLAGIGQLEFLPALFDEIVMAPALFTERMKNACDRNGHPGEITLETTL